MVTGSNGVSKILFEGSKIYEPSPRKSRTKDTNESDANSFGVVYVNDVGREAMQSERRAKFPVGSIIVRERLARIEDVQPQHLVVMIKRAAGFNPAGGDWEFLTVDGQVSKIRERQKKGSCLDCHSSQRDADFVFPLPQPK